MGNTGKPSGGCTVCKKRKIKCDETRPYCIRCKKANRECPGVPDPTMLVFRNTSPGSQSTAVSTPPSMLEEVAYPVEHQAVALFFHDYTGRPGDPRLKAKPMFLIPEIFLASLSTQPIHIALSACAIYLLSRYARAPQLKDLGASRYVEALQALRRSLASPQTATSDGTLGGIMMLIMWETHAATSGSFDAYKQHQDGALAIIRKRGRKQFEDPHDLAIFRGWRTQLVTSSIETNKPLALLDDDFDWFGDRGLPDQTKENSRLTEIAYHISLLRSRLDAAMPSNTPSGVNFEIPSLEAYNTNELDMPLIDPEQDACIAALCNVAERLDQELSDWFEDLPQEWWPTPTAIPTSSPHVWNGLIHMYPRPLATILFNFAYSLRIMLHGILIRMRMFRGESIRPQSLFKIRIAVDGISAAVPFAMGIEGLPISFKKNFLDHMGWSRANSVFQINGMYTAAAVGDVVPLEQRQWLKGRLEYIESVVGVSSAGVLAKHLRL